MMRFINWRIGTTVPRPVPFSLFRTDLDRVQINETTKITDFRRAVTSVDRCFPCPYRWKMACSYDHAV